MPLGPLEKQRLSLNAMTLEEKSPLLGMLAAGWRRIKSNRIVQLIFWARWAITLLAFLGTLLWYAYLEGKDISASLSVDYTVVQAAQTSLIADSLDLHEDLLNPNKKVVWESELNDLRSTAKTTIGALGALRAPTKQIEAAQRKYRVALEDLIGVANRLERGEVEKMALPLHNALQTIANEGAAFNKAVANFQGGMWPQLIGSIF